MLYKVRIGRDEYLGTPEEVVGWMARVAGAPGDGTPSGFMAGLAARLAATGRREPIDVSSALAFLRSLDVAGLARLSPRPEPSRDRVGLEEALGEGPVAFGDDVDLEDLEGL